MEACLYDNAFVAAILLAAGADIAAQDTKVMPWLFASSSDCVI